MEKDIKKNNCVKEKNISLRLKNHELKTCLDLAIFLYAHIHTLVCIHVCGGMYTYTYERAYIHTIQMFFYPLKVSWSSSKLNIMHINKPISLRILVLQGMNNFKTGC